MRRFLPTRLALALVLAHGSAHAEETEPPEDRYEPGVLPVVAGDTDVGLKLGAFTQLARFRGGIEPYAWRAQALGAVSIQKTGESTQSPYREAALHLDWPAVGAPVLRPSFALAYLRTTNRGYFGIGNDRSAERLWADLPAGSDAWIAARRVYQYDGTTIRAVANVIGNPVPHVRTLSSVRFERTLIDVYSGSRLENDIANGPGGGDRLYGVSDYDAILFGVGIALDTRDHETVPTRGQDLQLAMRWSPGAFDSEPYVGGTLHLRSWLPILGPDLVLGARLVVDVLSERAPLMELGRYGGFDGGYGPGGAMGVRGIPAGRLLGRTKLIGNLEARSMFLPFRVGSERFVLGAAAFADAGRVYTGTFSSAEELDGSRWKVHPGFGGGPRIRWGDSLLIRADVAYAPLGAEIGAAPGIYVDVEHIL
jgi:hypothetical protein